MRKKSIVPVYGVAAAWALYCWFFPLYKTSHFIVLVCLAALVYIVLTAIFPGKVMSVVMQEEPLRSGDEQIDSLLAEGEKAVAELRRLRGVVADETIRSKLDEIASITDKIFKDLLEDPSDYRQVKRFAEFYLPATLELLRAYDRFGKTGSGGENITGTLERIDSALDTIIDSYKKFFDSLFENQAIDIETDIRVLERMLKEEGLTGKDFHV
ncbi:MAG: 5-bromo-4-chloroindolyl phosphate hydrolysis family protein [Oscillospiraceae bacterium]|nr:5-bromo-4-chloroindolyl phosphate hydrolysis family protein [Oscillospiraceae bacterium]